MQYVQALYDTNGSVNARCNAVFQHIFAASQEISTFLIIESSLMLSHFYHLDDHKSISCSLKLNETKSQDDGS